MRFSVVIPVYNVERYLEQCIESVIYQTYKDIEIILVDDGSPDNCPVICDKYASTDKRVSVIHKENGGLSSARNAGLLAANGEYVIFLDSDDYYLQAEFLSEIDEIICKNNPDAVFFQRREYYENSDKFADEPTKYGEITNITECKDILLALAKNDKLDASAAMKVTKRDYLLGNELFFKEGLVCEDIEWFFRYAVNLKKVCLLDMASYCYRIRENSISHSIKLQNIKDLFYSIEKYAEDIRRKDYLSKEALLNYLAYQYFIVMGLSYHHLKGSDRKSIFKQCNKYKWLTKYSISGKTKKAALVTRLFGVNVAAMILGSYIAGK